MLTKSELREKLADFLYEEGDPDAEELADAFVERLDEDGAFEVEENEE
jgi:hypothetical protein